MTTNAALAGSPAWARLNALRGRAMRSGSIFLSDVGHGLLEVSHNSLALVGLLIVGAGLLVGGPADVRHAIEAQTLSWLQARQEARQPVVATEDVVDLGEPDAIARATALDPSDLNRAQAAVAMYLARRYSVAPEPISRLVQEAWNVGAAVKLDPTLILSVMAVESSFNPFAQSPVGAQGLMQVMTKIHNDKYVAFGGRHAAFDPVSNLRVGVQVLKECIARAGSVEEGLRHYVGAALSGEDGGYALKVLAEQSILRVIAGGGKVHAAVRAVAPVVKVRQSDEPAPAPAAVDVPTHPAAEAAPLPEKIALAR